MPGRDQYWRRASGTIFPDEGDCEYIPLDRLTIETRLLKLIHPSPPPSDPMIFFNKNVHLFCEEPGTCVFSGGGVGGLLVGNLNTNDLIDAFLAHQGLPLPPEGYLPNSSNLLIEGVTFSDSFGQGRNSIIEMTGRGLDMVFDKCMFANNNHQQPPASVIHLVYIEPLLEGEQLDKSITFRDSVTEENAFAYSIVSTSWSNHAGEPHATQPQCAVMEVTFDNSVITNNVIEGNHRGADSLSQRPGLFTVFSTRIKVLNYSAIVTNSIGRAPALVNLENFSNLMVSEDIVVAEILSALISTPLVTTLNYGTWSCRPIFSRDVGASTSHIPQRDVFHLPTSYQEVLMKDPRREIRVPAVPWLTNRLPVVGSVATRSEQVHVDERFNK